MYMCGRWRLSAALQRTMVPVLIKSDSGRTSEGTAQVIWWDFQQITPQEIPFGFYSLRARNRRHDVPVRRGSVCTVCRACS